MASAQTSTQNYGHSHSIGESKPCDQSIINGTGSYTFPTEAMQAHVYGWGWIICLYLERKGRINTWEKLQMQFTLVPFSWLS